MSIRCLSERKNEMIRMAQDIFDTYQNESQKFVEDLSEINKRLVEMKATIQDQEKVIKDNQDRINGDEEKIVSKTRQLSEYEDLIRKLEDRLKEKIDGEESSNKFNMIRMQAKEISEKDREIERLNKQVALMKERSKLRVTHNMDGGWSPTSSNNPQLNTAEDKSDGSIVSDEINTIIETVGVEIMEKEIGEIFKFRKKEYYAIKDDPNKVVYLVLKGDKRGERVGVWNLITTGTRKGKRSVILDD
jgi:hypothetical protein